MNVLIKTLVAIVLFSFSMGAYALPDQTAQSQPATPQIKATAPSFHFVLNAGMTYGGDTIYTVNYTNGTSKNIKAGSMMQIGMGGLWQFDQIPLAMMLSANYHFDSAAGSNGNIAFRRFPIEMLAYYTGKERFRIGGGLRIVNAPQFTATINGLSDKIIFNNTTGLVAEIGYQLSPQAWVNFRAVSEKYQAKSDTYGGSTISLAGTKPFSGSHLGVNLSYEF